MVIDQEARDNAIEDLLKKLSGVYTFMNGDGRLAEIESMQELDRRWSAPISSFIILRRRVDVSWVSCVVAA